MWKTVSLVLPVVFPSWQFFKAIEPSPRIEWGFVSGGGALEWRAFRPRPLTASPVQMVTRLFWNPHWNDTLFAVSCAERIDQSPDGHSIEEIKRRVVFDAQALSGDALQFRLVFVQRDGADLLSEVVYLSDIFLTAEAPVC